MLTKGTKHLSKQEFDLIKTLHEAGLKPSKIRQVTGRTPYVVKHVTQSATYEDYKKPRKKVVAKPKQPAPEVNTSYIASLLESIDRRLQWLEENIPAQGSKKFWLR